MATTRVERWRAQGRDAALRAFVKFDRRYPDIVPRVREVADRLQPVTSRIKVGLEVITPLGATVIATGIVTWILGWQLGWVEMMYAAAACLVLLLCCIGLTFGRTRLEVVTEVSPKRLTVGGSSAGRVTVKNIAKSPSLPVVLEVPIGIGAARFNLPAMAPSATHEDLFVVPTERRGIIDIGPAVTLRGDPLGILRRVAQWNEKLEIIVHPRTIPLEPLGRGLLRDLEGQSTNDISMSDLAFHTLRDYAPGDDRRYVHWRSSAKASGTTPGGKLLVRQFLDTRRSYLTVVVDGNEAAYPDPEHFEIALSAGASVVMRALRDEMDVTVVAGDHMADHKAGVMVVDAFSRAELNDRPLSVLSLRALKGAPDTSVAIFVTGASTDFSKLRLAASYFPPEVSVLAVKVDPRSRVGIDTVDAITVLTVAALADLPNVLSGVAVQ